MQDPDRCFRINQPADDWPAPSTPLEPRAPIPNGQALVDNLRQTGDRNGPGGIRAPVCDAFGGLGFVATHVGGNAAPDGYIDAPRGPLGYCA